MPLDRQDIEKRDFPIGRRGYDPDAVDRHLRSIADQVGELRAQLAASPPGGADSLAHAASDQVRGIVEAAEASSADIRREAKARAEEVRKQAAGEARDLIAGVSEATAAMLQRVDAMEGELGSLVETLRSEANRLSADLALLGSNMGELRTAATGGGEAAVVEEALEEDAALAAEPEPEPERVEEKEPTVEEKEPTVEEKEPTVEEPGQDGADSEGARLIALNMALNGTPREETDRYLAENFELPDRGALLDEVYARAG